MFPRDFHFFIFFDIFNCLSVESMLLAHMKLEVDTVKFLVTDSGIPMITNRADRADRLKNRFSQLQTCQFRL